MNLAMLLEMAAGGAPDRVALGSRDGGVGYAELLDRSRRTARWIRAREIDNVCLVDVNGEAVPLLLFGSAIAGKPFAPINYRLTDAQLAGILRRVAPAVVIAGPDVVPRLSAIDGIEVLRRDDFLALVRDGGPEAEPAQTADPDDVAVLLFTSGTTGEPKAALLRHRHLVSYVISTIEFMCAEPDEAILVSVPPYHVAGMSGTLSSTYSCRRVVHLPAFTPEAWVTAAREEQVTHAMVVPTMLGRILDVLERESERLPHLRHLSYGGGRMPVAVIERAMRLLPDVGFVNAYGLTETSSTVAMLGPDDHRLAFAGAEAHVRARLGSVGRPIPTVEVEIRDVDGRAVAAGVPGEIWIRGEQVAGEYVGRQAESADGWFPTRDGGFLDADGYLFIEGRLDDVIVRGGENTSPGEVEEVLVAHPGVLDACVVGVPDVEWGERIVAAVVAEPGAGVGEAELKDWVRARLRSSRTPEHIQFRTELPYTETGKLLRRLIRSEMAAQYSADGR